MKKTIPIIIILLLGCLWGYKSVPQQNIAKNNITTIAEIVGWANGLEWNTNEIKYLDSANIIGGGYYPVRDAERELDTIVNHLRIHFYKHE